MSTLPASGKPIDDLPLPGTHWIASRKKDVVRAVENGLVPLEEVLERYHMSEEEFRSWQRGLHEAGLRGLGVKHLRLRRKRAQNIRQ